MDFGLRDETGSRPAILEGRHLLCADAACRRSEPLAEAGPQGFTCSWASCSSLAYGFDSEFHRLEIRFADRERRSNVFFNSDFESSYTVRVRTDDLLVEKTSGSNPPKTPLDMGMAPPPGRSIAGFEDILFPVRFLLALSLTLLFELGGAWALFRKSPRRRRLLACVLAANIISLPLVWASGVLAGPTSYWPPFAWAEGGAVLFEGLFIGLLNRDSLSPRKALLFSLALNALSVVGGELILMCLSPQRAFQALAWVMSRLF